jgi:hypothetical protein
LPCKSSRTFDARKIPFTVFLIWLLVWWFVCLICEGHGGRKPSEVSCWVDGLLSRTSWFMARRLLLCGSGLGVVFITF